VRRNLAGGSREIVPTQQNLGRSEDEITALGVALVLLDGTSRGSSMEEISVGVDDDRTRRPKLS
jgi:hypothetical protein